MKVLKLFALGICFVLGACSNQSTSIVQTNEHGIIRKSKCSRVSKRKVHFTKRSV